MSDVLFYLGRYFLFGFGILGAIFVYMYLCGVIGKFFPRIGLALSGVVIAGIVALLAGLTVTVYLGSRVGVIAMVPIYIVSLIGWVVFVFTEKNGEAGSPNGMIRKP
jgi:hypothetical protein